MRVTMAENLARVFTTMIKRVAATVIFFFLLGSIGCNDEFVGGEIPPAAFNDIVINLDLPEYQNLSFDKGYITLSEGVRGIILYRVNGSTYNAFEVNCSYQPYEACANVRVHSSGVFLKDDCCGSTFSPEDGIPTGGPARLPLRRYTIINSGRTLTITDTPLN